MISLRGYHLVRLDSCTSKSLDTFSSWPSSMYTLSVLQRVSLGQYVSDSLAQLCLSTLTQVNPDLFKRSMNYNYLDAFQVARTQGIM